MNAFACRYVRVRQSGWKHVAGREHHPASCRVLPRYVVGEGRPAKSPFPVMSFCRVYQRNAPAATDRDEKKKKIISSSKPSMESLCRRPSRTLRSRPRHRLGLSPAEMVMQLGPSDRSFGEKLAAGISNIASSPFLNVPRQRQREA